MQLPPFLDLTKDDMSDATGKRLVVNGTDYVFLDRLADGSKSMVFPIRNCRSGLTRFVAKILKYRLGSPEYASIRENGWKAPFTMKCEGISVLHTEYYTIPGGLITFQTSLASVRDPMYFEPQMTAALNAEKSGRPDEIVALYRDVLRENPNHTDAMINLGGFLAQTGDPVQALALLDKAKSIDANIRDIYYQTALVFASIGKPAAALAIMDETLTRWKYDYESIQRQITIAITFDHVELVQRRLSEVQDLIGRLGKLADLTPELTKSQARLAESRRLASEGVEARKRGDWAAAKLHYSKASSVTKDNATHQLNAFVCRYHLGENVNWKEVGSLAYRLATNAYEGSLLLAALFAARGNDLAQAGALFAMLDYIEHPVDLPSIPIEFAQVAPNAWGSLEEIGVKELIGLLQQLADSGKLRDNSVKPIRSLLVKYKKRQELAANQPATNPQIN